MKAAAVALFGRNLVMARGSAFAPVAICALLLLGAGPAVAERTQARMVEDARGKGVLMVRRGIFVGVSLDGVSLDVDLDANAAYYGKEIDKPSDVLDGASLSDPPSALALRGAVESWEKGR